MNMTEIQCVYCNSKRTIPTYKVTRANKTSAKLYCSRKCINDYKKNDWRKVRLNCSQCNKEVSIPEGMYNHQMRKHPDKKTWFCDTTCYRQYKSDNKVAGKLVDCECDYCSSLFKIMQCHLKYSKHFCTRECQGKYTARTYNLGGRSKLETLIEAYIRKDLPDLEFVTNDRSVCDPVELDFYFPGLNKAIEINGPSHYQVVYDLKTLNRQKSNDSYKNKICKEKNISLCIVTKTLNLQKDNSLEIYNTTVKPFLII